MNTIDTYISKLEKEIKEDKVDTSLSTIDRLRKSQMLFNLISYKLEVNAEKANRDGNK